MRFEMISLRSLKMEKREGFFATDKDIETARKDLEKITERAFNDYTRKKQESRECAHGKFLD